MYQFNGFTEKANKALNLAIDCAGGFGHDYSGSEHILLGLLKESTGVDAAVLTKLGVTAEGIEALIKEKMGAA